MRLDQRADATSAVSKRFRARPFGWKNGGTCVHLARAQMRALGHRPPKMPRFYSALGARRALANAGFANLTELFDSMLPRIAPAAMWVGDIALVPGEEGFDSVAVWDGSGALLMYHAGADSLANVYDAVPHVTAAWRL